MTKQHDHTESNERVLSYRITTQKCYSHQYTKLIVYSCQHVRIVIKRGLFWNFTIDVNETKEQWCSYSTNKYMVHCLFKQPYYALVVLFYIMLFRLLLLQGLKTSVDFVVKSNDQHSFFHAIQFILFIVKFIASYLRLGNEEYMKNNLDELSIQITRLYQSRIKDMIMKFIIKGAPQV